MLFAVLATCFAGAMDISPLSEIYSCRMTMKEADGPSDAPSSYKTVVYRGFLCLGFYQPEDGSPKQYSPRLSMWVVYKFVDGKYVSKMMHFFPNMLSVEDKGKRKDELSMSLRVYESDSEIDISGFAKVGRNSLFETFSGNVAGFEYLKPFVKSGKCTFRFNKNITEVARNVGFVEAIRPVFPKDDKFFEYMNRFN